MSNIIIPNERDPLKRGKSCPHFCPLEDGTKSGDPRYCNLSLHCKQVGMISDWHKFRDQDGNEAFDYFCTGVYATEEHRGIDKEVS
jgi:hypothetical protein